MFVVFENVIKHTENSFQELYQFSTGFLDNFIHILSQV